MTELERHIRAAKVAAGLTYGAVVVAALLVWVLVGASSAWGQVVTLDEASACAERTGVYTSVVIERVEGIAPAGSTLQLAGAACYGRADVEAGGTLAVALWADNPATVEQDGAVAGEVISLLADVRSATGDTTRTGAWSQYYEIGAFDAAEDPVTVDGCALCADRAAAVEAAYDALLVETLALREMAEERGAAIDSLQALLDAGGGAPGYDDADAPGLSDRQIRQFLGYQQAQAENLYDVVDALLARLATVQASIEQRIEAAEGGGP